MKDFSIVVPSFNSAATVCETLRSIQAQNDCLKRIRSVILADDGSLDNTVTVAEGSWDCSVPLKIVRNTSNKGEYRNLNAAVGSLDHDIDWFFIVHADDIVKANWLDVMIRNIDLAVPSLGTITASWDVLNSDGSVTTGECREERDNLLVNGPDAVRHMLLRGCCWKITSCCIRKATFVQLNGLDTAYRQSGDVDFCLRLLSAGWDLLYIPMALSVYRIHAASVTTNNRRRCLDLRDDFWIFKRFNSSLSQSQVFHWYVRMLHATTSRVWHSFAGAEFKRAAVAAMFGMQMGRYFLQDATRAFKCNSLGVSSGLIAQQGLDMNRRNVPVERPD
jgi:glycosyltransferase involved in cell wall biosynthesis